MRLFIAAIEEGTIAAAAAREHVVASAVSRRIARLEAVFQAPLVSRTRKGLEPTAAGMALLPLARQVLLDLNDLYVQMHQYSSGSRGDVRVSASVPAITQFLPGEIKSFRTRHPHVQIQLEEESSLAVARAVAENAAHIGLFTWGVPHGQTLETFPYHSYQLVVITPNRHPLVGRGCVSFEETLDFDYVGLPRDSTIHFQLLKAAAELNRTLNLSIEVSAYDALCRMVEAGLGIGVLPKPVAQPYIDSQRLYAMVLDEPWADQALSICVRSFDALPVAAKLLVNHLRQTL
ncbi:MAG: LysR family transcriptional regulator [Pseudomonadota bacterium]|nr:LysR family transcriptional regulator [Pseudomonadota bacterium]